jgi:hypothetical protein
MSKSMTKYQLDHFKQKVKRQFDPLIEKWELIKLSLNLEKLKRC